MLAAAVPATRRTAPQTNAVRATTAPRRVPRGRTRHRPFVGFAAGPGDPRSRGGNRLGRSRWSGTTTLFVRDPHGHAVAVEHWLNTTLTELMAGADVVPRSTKRNVVIVEVVPAPVDPVAR